MTTELNPTGQDNNAAKVVNMNNNGGAVYGIGLIGAWVYFFKHAETNQERFMAFLKGIVWPAFLVYELFVFLKKE